MPRRSCWLLLHLAWGLALMPGCTLLPRREPPGRPQYTAPAPQEAPAPPRVEVKKPAAIVTSEKRAETEPPPRPAEPPPALVTRVEKPAPPLVEALRCMLEDRHQDALRHLQGYGQETQVFLLRLLPTLALFEKKPLEQLAPDEVEVLYTQLQGLLVALRPRAPLVIERMVFCKEVNGIGNYQALPPSHAFLADDQVQLYVELSNFASEPRGGVFETRLSISLEIRDAAGNLRKRLPIDQPPRRSLTRLHDFGENYCFCVPSELEPGTYQLTLQVVDETVPELQRVERKSIEFRVTSAMPR